jgi:acyl-CoA reductase-like NAD-dependent aldehyde dehydrogenase
MTAAVLQSHIAGRWLGAKPAQQLRSAVNGQPVASTHAEAIDFGEAVHYARNTGLPNLLKLDFQQRAAILRALAKYINDNKEALYAVSSHTGATRNDGWIDIFVACDSTPSLLFMNNRDGTFREEGVTRGVALSDDGMEQAGMGVGIGDYNLDGHLDLFRGHAKLLIDIARPEP